MCQVVVGLALLVALTAAAGAQDRGATFPTKGIRVVIGYPPSSGVDAFARLISERLVAKGLPPMVIENRPGASGHIATEIVAKAAPDGYTILGVPPAFVTTPLMFKSLPFDPDAMVPITVAVTQANVLMVAPSRLPAVRTVADLIALAKAKPGALNYGTAGNGGSQHLSAELMNSLAGDIKIVHIPYKGAAVMTALLAADIELGWYTLGGSMAHLKTGRLRALAVGGVKRHPDLPDVPTLGEALPGLVSASWSAFIAPANTPAETVNRINALFVEALRHPDVQRRAVDLTAEVVANSVAEAKAYLAEEKERWGKVIRAANIKAD